MSKLAPTFPASDRLVLVPTPLERDLLAGSLARISGLAIGWTGELRLCGFGPIVAAAATATAIARHRPRHVVLAGVAGSYSSTLCIGRAYSFGEVACYGVGAGSGTGFQSASSLGWKQWEGADGPGEPSEAIGDVIQLDRRPLLGATATSDLPNAPQDGGDAHGGHQLLTVTSAAGDGDDCRDRLEHFPNAAAEDMESFGVAVACKMHGVRLSVVRGISNRAGDRDPANWQMAPALESVAVILKRLFFP